MFIILSIVTHCSAEDTRSRADDAFAELDEELDNFEQSDEVPFDELYDELDKAEDILFTDPTDKPVEPERLRKYTAATDAKLDSIKKVMMVRAKYLSFRSPVQRKDIFEQLAKSGSPDTLQLRHIWAGSLK